MLLVSWVFLSALVSLVPAKILTVMAVSSVNRVGTAYIRGHLPCCRFHLSVSRERTGYGERDCC